MSEEVFTQKYNTVEEILAHCKAVVSCELSTIDGCIHHMCGVLEQAKDEVKEDPDHFSEQLLMGLHMIHVGYHLAIGEPIDDNPTEGITNEPNHYSH